jgi:hypothetical protein
MAAFLYGLPSGIPGTVNRAFAAIIEAQSVTPSGTTGAPVAYGVPMVPDTASGNVGNMRTIASGDAYVYGVLARPFPVQSPNWPVDPLGTSAPLTALGGPCDILVFGYISVLLSGSTAAAKGGQVYIWTAAASGTHIVGGFEATNPSSNGFAMSNAMFMGPADANGNVEIRIGPPGVV